MNKNKIFDCITFYDENLITNARIEILNNYVDYFIICESKYDHKGNKKEINFNLKNKNYEKKVRHLIIDKNFPDVSNGWKVEEFQREYILNGLKDASDNDIILYSDSDEIPNPIKISNLELNKKYVIFMQKFFVYKLNVFNKHESPWEGTRACKKKDLKSVNFLRKKILKRNLNKPFWKFSLERNIQIINDGGWHFNNLYSPEKISKKLKTFQHTEFESKKFSSVDLIKTKIENLEDLFGRDHKYQKVIINKEYPEYILNNLDLFKKHIL
tara:strand:- start:34 stop:843 length:810 start_codon:yes stop_codon:yes gene_type:complete